MKKSLFALLSLGLVLTACPTPTPDPGPGPTPKPTYYSIIFNDEDGTKLATVDTLEGTVPVYPYDNPTKADDDEYTYEFSGWDPELVPATKDTVYTATYSKTEIVPDVIDLGTKTIAEVRALCEALPNPDNKNVVVDMTRKVTIKGLALSKINLVKTTKKFGLDLSSPGKTIFGDATGSMACASPMGDGSTLWGKVDDHAGESTSSYIVTGYLSMYLGKPELYVPEKTFEWKQDLNIKYDYSSEATTVTVDEFYTKAKAVNYNCAGHAYDEVVTLKGMYVYQKRDNVYVCTNGTQFVKVAAGRTSLSVGYRYDITGYISLNNWIPSVFAYQVKNATEGATGYDTSEAVSTTITDFLKKKSSKDDTATRMDSYIDLFKTAYTVEAYVTAYTENGKYYVTVSDSYYKGEEYVSGHVTAAGQYKMAALCGENCWNLDYDQMFKFCPLKDYIDQEVKVEIYFVPFLQEFVTYNKVVSPFWKFVLFSDLVPPRPVE